jgi:hypothetical protein
MAIEKDVIEEESVEEKVKRLHLKRESDWLTEPEKRLIAIELARYICSYIYVCVYEYSYPCMNV